jgi:signal peptidase I
MSWSEKLIGEDWPATIQSVAGTVAIAVFVVTFLAQAFTIPSESMEQTLLIGDYLLVDKLCYGNGGVWERLLPYRKIRRGDIVVFHYPVNPSQAFVKRVVAVPGDRLRLINKRVFVNGTPLNEPYVQYVSNVRSPYRDDFPRTDRPDYGVDAKWWKEMPKLVEDHQLIIPEGHYFVLGDNRDDSQDSRYWGFVPRQNIIGRPMLIYWSSNSLNNDLTGSPTPGDRLYHLAYAVTHVFQTTRWGRTFRLVR